MDHPEKYGLARGRLPYPTGILSVLTFSAIFFFSRETPTGQDMMLLFCILLLMIVCAYDDLKGLPAWARLCVQILIGFLLFASGTRIYTITNPLGGILKLDSLLVSNEFSMFNFQFSIPGGPLPLLSGIFTIIWIVLTTNAFNWFDGIPGQVSVLSIIGSLTLGFLALSNRVAQPEIALIAFIITGCALGSAIFDFPPNKTVLGDAGSMFFGLMLGTLSIYAGGKVATALLVLGVPILDAFIVTITRIIHGTSPLRGGRDHLHHRLLAKGWTERQVITLTILLGSCFGITALFLNTFEKFVAILLLGGIMMGLTWYSRGGSGSEK